MEMIIGKTAGFCYGVKNAVNKTKEEVQKQKTTYCLGELVHNKQVTKKLEEKGLIIINNIEDARENVIIRSHGVPEEIYTKAKDLNLKVVDLTCPNVLKIHNIVKEYSTKGYYIFIIGQKEHAETIGTVSYCKDNSTILEKEEDVITAVNNFKKSNLEKILVVSQTTFSLEKFNKIVKNIKNSMNAKIEIKNTICNATSVRQKETQELAKQVDLMIIIGGRHSSNTNKLYEIAKKECSNCILIETAAEINKDYVKNVSKIGIMAGASTPNESIENTVEKLNEIC